MKKDVECKIVHDLLPSFIDKLTSKETNAFIEEHLKTCDSCKKVYEDMTRDVKADKKIEMPKEVKYFKKFKTKITKWRVIVLILIVAILAVSGKMYINYSRCDEIATKNYQILAKYETLNNFKYVYTIGDGGAGTELEYLYKDGIAVERHREDDGTYTIRNWGNKETGEFIYLYYGLKGGDYAEVNSNRTQLSLGSYLMDNESGYARSLLGNNWILNNISTEMCQGKECYVSKTEVTGTKTIAYYEKETGLMIQEIHISQNGNMLVKQLKNFEKDVVTDEDVKKPDLSQFIVVDQL